jgi:hypothetical protein
MSQTSRTISADLYSANSIPTICFRPGTKICHAIHFLRTKSLFFIQLLPLTMPQVTIRVSAACTNNVYNQLGAGEEVHHIETAFSLKRIQNWMECKACMLHKSSYSYPLPPMAFSTPALLFSGLLHPM